MTQPTAATSRDEDDRAAWRASAVAAAACYLVLGVWILVEQWGRTTSDTRLDLTGAPGEFLRASLTLWNPRVSLGELQNQAYGYLFPQGLWFTALDAAGVADWVSQRLWSLLLLVLACEGLRRVNRAIGLGPWASLAGGLAYGLTPRFLAELGVRSAEIVPAATVPWAVLPVLLALSGRLGHRTAAVLSAAALACSGGVNGTVTVAPIPLVAILVLWAVLTGRAPRAFLVWWGAMVAAAHLWWAAALVQLGAYSPPFFDYVEDARTSTEASGFTAALRGSSNWVNYLEVAGQPWWPAGYVVTHQPWVVLATGLVAAAGLIGLARLPSPVRLPLVGSAVLGLLSLVAAHTGPLTGPGAAFWQHLLDGSLAPLRNIHKADPLLRIPLGIGFGVAVQQLGGLAARRGPALARRGLATGRRVAAGAVTVLLVASVAGSAWPVLDGRLRTPGWQQLPDHWPEAAAWLDENAEGAAWIVPGAGFAIQRWGWTMEEPAQVLGDFDWVTRSQVPLTPASTIRMLSWLEELLETGSGSPYLGDVLRRVGISHVVVRHDLDADIAETVPPSLVSIALARSSGITRAADFGRLELGPAVEVYAVTGTVRGAGSGPADLRVRDRADAVTVAGTVADAMTALGSGLVTDAAPMMVRGDPLAGGSWDEPADIVGDAFRRRERNFGRVHDAESAVMTRADDYRMGRRVPGYPGPAGAEPVVAEEIGVERVTASSSGGYADVLGPVHPEVGPHAALDGDIGTGWQAALFSEADEQWLELDLGETRELGEITLTSQPWRLGASWATAWTVRAGDVTREVVADPGTGVARVDLDGVEARTVRLEVDAAAGDGAVSVQEVDLAGIETGRTLRLPTLDDDQVAAEADLLFSARPETRPCTATLLGPACAVERARPAEEATGIDRTFELPLTGDREVVATAVSRSRVGTAELIQPQQGLTGRGSSWLGDDPTVAPRLAYDGDVTTSWLADPRDRTPTLVLEWPRERRFNRITVRPPTTPGVAPTQVELRGGGEVRTVDLSGVGRFPAFRASRVTLTFSRLGAEGSPLGVSEVSLGPNGSSVPLDGAAQTGAVCGYGPPLVVDGRRRDTRVEGFVGSVVGNGLFRVVPCQGGREVRLEPGEHRVRLEATEQFQPVSLQLVGGSSERAVSSRSLEVLEASDLRQRVAVSAGEEAIVSTTRNYNDGWVATLEGQRLPQVQVDGWAQGWIVPADLSGEVLVEFAPQTRYRVLLVAGLVLLGAVLLAGLALAVRLLVRGLPDAVEPPAAQQARHEGSHVRGARLGGRRLAVAIGLGGAVVWVFLGPVVLVAGAFGLALRRRSGVVLGAAAVLLATGVLLEVLAVADAVVYPPTSSDAATAAGVALAVVAALTGRHRGRPAGG